MLAGMVHKVISWLGYPLVTGGAVAFSWWALGHHWPAWAIGVVVVTVATVLVVLLEQLIPYSRTWATPRGDRKTDLLHFILSNRTFDLGTFFAISVFTPFGGWLSAKLGWGLWPTTGQWRCKRCWRWCWSSPPWYWMHRLEHTWPLFWRVHSVHKLAAISTFGTWRQPSAR